MGGRRKSRETRQIAIVSAKNSDLFQFKLATLTKAIPYSMSKGDHKSVMPCLDQGAYLMHFDKTRAFASFKMH